MCSIFKLPKTPAFCGIGIPLKLASATESIVRWTFDPLEKVPVKEIRRENFHSHLIKVFYCIIKMRDS